MTTVENPLCGLLHVELHMKLINESVEILHMFANSAELRNLGKLGTGFVVSFSLRGSKVVACNPRREEAEPRASHVPDEPGLQNETRRRVG